MKKRIWSIKSALLILFVICIVSVPSYISYNGLRYRSEYTQLLDKGSYTWGIVIEKGKTYSGWEVTGYTVRYKYTVIIPDQGAVTINSSSEILRSSWEQIQTGSQILIIYDPRNPSRNFAIVADVPDLWDQIIPMVICVSFGIWVLIFWIYKVRG